MRSTAVRSLMRYECSCADPPIVNQAVDYIVKSPDGNDVFTACEKF